MNNWWQEIWFRSVPGNPPDWLTWGGQVGPLVVAGIGVVSLFIEPIWRMLAAPVTVVHELGHAFVGVLTGRTITGIVIRPDLSGHAVTKGKPEGLGRVLTSWVGYPAPAALGAVLIWASLRGWSSTLLALALLSLLISLPFSRSMFTVLVLVGCILAVGSLWWWHPQPWVEAAVLLLGVVLLGGAWRSLIAVMRARGEQDPDTLAKITWFPRTFWILTFVIAIGAATYWAGLMLWDYLPKS